MRAALVVLAACGGAATVPTPALRNTSEPGLEVAEWAAVSEGATFHMRDRMHIVAIGVRVERVESTPAKRTLHLRWTNARRERDTIELTETTVRFVERGQTFARAAKPIAEVELGPAFTLLREDGAVCYVIEDMPTDGSECGDVCEGDFCVHPTRGLVGGHGIGWPDRNIFEP